MGTVSSTWGGARLDQCRPRQVAGDVTGVDLDESEFTDARAYAAEHGIDNVKFVEGSIYQLDFADASFDVCTLSSR